MQKATRREGTERGGLGQGIYSLSELRLYLAFYASPRAGDRALYWLETALNPVDHSTRQPDYSFSDLISLFVVSELVGHGMTPAAIKRAEAWMRKRFKTARPFVNEEIATDGQSVFLRSEHAEQVENANHGGQQAHREIVGPYLRRVQYRGTDAPDWRPAVAWSPLRGVTLDPNLQFGEPVVEGTRVPTSAVAGIASVAGIREAANRLDIAVADAKAALRFERSMAALS